MTTARIADFKPRPSLNPEMDELFRKTIEEIATKAADAENALTKEQFTEAILQAVKCGDFTRLVVASPGNGQAVIYIPFARQQEMEERIKDLEDQIAFLQRTGED